MLTGAQSSPPQQPGLQREWQACSLRVAQDLNDPEEPEPVEEPHSPMSSLGFDPELDFDTGEGPTARPARAKRRQARICQSPACPLPGNTQGFCCTVAQATSGSWIRCCELARCTQHPRDVERACHHAHTHTHIHICIVMQQRWSTQPFAVASQTARLLGVIRIFWPGWPAWPMEVQLSKAVWQATPAPTIPCARWPPAKVPAPARALTLDLRACSPLGQWNWRC